MLVDGAGGLFPRAHGGDYGVCHGNCGAPGINAGKACFPGSAAAMIQPMFKESPVALPVRRGFAPVPCARLFVKQELSIVDLNLEW